MEIGLSSFGETTPDFLDDMKTVSHGERLRRLVDEIVLADQVGLDVYGLGEHHRADYAASTPPVVLAAASTQTKNIRLSSAVTVLSSDDPVRVFQQFATLDGLSKGRAEIMVGRGSFTESYPLFGYSLQDYNELFAEKLELLLAIRDSEKVTWKGKFRPELVDTAVYPRPDQKKMPIWIAVGGTPESVMRAGRLGLPLNIAIIGGNPEHFIPLVQLYRQTAIDAGHNPEELEIAVHSHGYVAETNEIAVEEFFPSTSHVMNILGRERGWAPYTKASFDAARASNGALYVGDPAYVAEKIIHLQRALGITRFMMHTPLGSMPHEKVLQSIRLLGEQVAPIVRSAVK